MPPKTQLDFNSNEYGDYFLFLGRGEKNKRIDLLIPAFNEIETDFQLTLTIDKDELSSSLREIVDKNKRIHLLGRVTEEKKQTLLANCSALILPTDYEAFGIVNFEASYYKKPLLLSELEIFKSILANNGVIYFKNNFDAIEKGIREFISLGKIKKHEMGIKNYSNLNSYTFEKVSKQYGHLFNGLF